MVVLPFGLLLRAGAAAAARAVPRRISKHAEARLLCGIARSASWEAPTLNAKAPYQREPLTPHTVGQYGTVSAIG